MVFVQPFKLIIPVEENRNEQQSACSFNKFNIRSDTNSKYLFNFLFKIYKTKRCTIYYILWKNICKFQVHFIRKKGKFQFDFQM